MSAKRLMSKDAHFYIMWDDFDEGVALVQGWGIRDYDKSGILVIQKIDDMRLFDSDNSAIRFVRKKMRAGDDTARRAILLHDANRNAFRQYQARKLKCDAL